MRDIKGVDPDGRGVREELKRVEGGDVIFRIYYVRKKTIIFNNRKKKRKENTRKKSILERNKKHG